MKLKLLAFGMLVLLLCTVLPMSVATAAPAKTTITVPVYVLTYAFGSGEALVGPVVGKITYDVTTPHNYALTISKLQPNTAYELGITDSPPPGLVDGTVQLLLLDATNANGRLHQTGTMDDFDSAAIANGLTDGGVFILMTP